MEDQPRIRLSSQEVEDKSTAGLAALSICESMLIALNDLGIIDDAQTRAILVDAAVSHRNAADGEDHLNQDQHSAVADLIDIIIAGNNSVRAFKGGTDLSGT